MGEHQELNFEQWDRMCELRHKPIDGFILEIKDNLKNLSRRVNWIFGAVIVALLALVGNLVVGNTSPEPKVEVKLVVPEEITERVYSPNGGWYEAH